MLCRSAQSNLQQINKKLIIVIMARRQLVKAYREGGVVSTVIISSVKFRTYS